MKMINNLFGLSETSEKTHWYENLRHRTGVWKHLTSPFYILAVLFLSILLMPSVFLTVSWYPWVLYITNQNTSLGKISSHQTNFFIRIEFQQRVIHLPSIYRRWQH